MSGASISYPHYHAQMGKQQRCTAVAYQSSTDLRPEKMAASNAATSCYAPYEMSPQLAAPAPTPQQRQQQPQAVQVPKDYSRPLHVDCSVEYELPNTAKPPQGVRNEPLLMIHPCYFRKIESQRRSPFINNLPPMRQATATALKKRVRVPAQQPQVIQQVPQTASQYPVQYAAWDAMPTIVPMTAAQQPYAKRDPYLSSGGDSGNWTDPERSPDRPEDKHILSGKYRQYLRAHRLHPYAASTGLPFPHQVQQVCYNV